MRVKIYINGELIEEVTEEKCEVLFGEYVRNEHPENAPSITDDVNVVVIEDY